MAISLLLFLSIVQTSTGDQLKFDMDDSDPAVPRKRTQDEPPEPDKPTYNCLSWFVCLFCSPMLGKVLEHYNDVIMGAMASQITSLTIVYPTVYSGADQRKHQSSASLAFVRGIHRWPVNSPHKCPATRKMFPFDDVIMKLPQITIKSLTPERYGNNFTTVFSN